MTPVPIQPILVFPGTISGAGMASGFQRRIKMVADLLYDDDHRQASDEDGERSQKGEIDLLARKLRAIHDFSENERVANLRRIAEHFGEGDSSGGDALGFAVVIVLFRFVVLRA